MYYKFISDYLKSILACCSILLTGSLFSQIQTRPVKPGYIEKITLKKEEAGFPVGINVGGITIMDSRNDTSNIGYSQDKIVRQYQLKNGFVNDLNTWFIDYLKIAASNSNTARLFINIRKLRVSDQAALIILDNGKTGRANNGWNKDAITKIEYYLQKDSLFIPLYRFDTIVHFEGELNKYADKHVSAYISRALKLSLEKLFTINIDSIQLPKKNILLRDIEKVNKQRQDLPIYTSVVHKKGIYKNFEDFKMGRISWTDFEFRKGKMGDIIYIKENGIETPIRAIWGFCDGENFYINSGDVYSKLIRVGNTFYFEGTKNILPSVNENFDWGRSALNGIQNYYGNPGSNIAPSSGSTVNYSLNLKYYQLDMENGKIY